MKAMDLGFRRGTLCSLLGIGLLFLMAIPVWAADTAGAETVAEWRRVHSRIPFSETAWSQGVLSAGVASGMRCRVSTTVAELEAYMRYRAESQRSVADTLQLLWSEQGCVMPPLGNVLEEKPERWRTIIPMLWSLRTSSDLAWLRKYIEESRGLDESLATKADDETTTLLRLSALLARDRLREISGKQQTQ